MKTIGLFSNDSKQIEIEISNKQYKIIQDEYYRQLDAEMDPSLDCEINIEY